MSGSSNLVAGCVCIAVLVASWVGQSELEQYVANSHKAAHYDKPYFTILVRNLIAYTPFLPIGLGIQWALSRFYDIHRWPAGAEHRRKEFWRQYVHWQLRCGPMIFLAGYTWYLSLPRTNVAANTAIYNSASVFVLLGSYFLLTQPVTRVHILAIALGVAGVAIVAVEQVEKARHKGGTGASGGARAGEKAQLLGYIYLISGVVAYALWEVVYKLVSLRIIMFGVMTLAGYEVIFKLVGREMLYRGPHKVLEMTDAMIFLGGLGVATALTAGPLLPVWHWLGWETFELPPSTRTWEFLVANSFMDGALNCALLVGIQLTSPLFMQMGSSLATPVSVVVDLLVHPKVHYTWVAALGMLIIMVSFLIIAKTERDEETHKHQKISEHPSSSDEDGPGTPGQSSVVVSMAGESDYLYQGQRQDD